MLISRLRSLNMLRNQFQFKMLPPFLKINLRISYLNSRKKMKDQIVNSARPNNGYNRRNFANVRVVPQQELVKLIKKRRRQPQRKLKPKKSLSLQVMMMRSLV